MLDFEEVKSSFMKNYNYNSSVKRKIGLECEFPIVNSKTGEAVDYDTIRSLFNYLKGQGHKASYDTGTNEMVGVEIESSDIVSSQVNYKTDVVGTDVGYCTVEISFVPADNIYSLESHFNQIMPMLVKFLDEKGFSILGYGVQPITRPGKKLLANKGRYVFFEQDALNRNIDQRDGVDLHYFTSSSSCQSHVEASKEDAIDLVNIFNGLSGLFVALFANSPVWKGQIDQEWKAVREIFWDKGWTNRLDQIGVAKKFANAEDYVEYIASFRPLMVKRGSEFIKILNRKTFKEFLTSEESEGIDVNGNPVKLIPEDKDVFFQGGFAWFDGRLSASYGTVEFRVCCEQPQGETFAVPAIQLGVAENKDKALELLSRYNWQEWGKLRFDALRHAMDAEVGDQSIMKFLEELVEIADDGLKKRGLNEEKFLDILRDRIKSKTTPADKAIASFKNNKIENFIKELSFKY
jgi:glutamate--cysteine ligase